MNILYHHRTRGSGAEGVHIKGIVAALREKGHTVNILSFPGADPEKTEDSVKMNNESQKSFFIRGMHWLSGLSKSVPEFVFEWLEILYNLIALARLKQSFRQESIDLIYERYSLFMFFSIWLANKHKIPIVLEVNDSVLVPRVRPLKYKWLAKKIEKWVFTNCTGIVFISKQFREMAAQEYGQISKTVICPNAADISKFNLKLYKKKCIQKEYGLTGKIVCGYVGAFVYWHGIDWFVEKIAPRIKEQPELVLLLIGDGVCYKAIKEIVIREQIEKQIMLTGRVSHNDIPKYLTAMDFGILPDSNTYGSPMKLFEFMAMGCGMVVPGFPPIREVVIDKKTGWIYPPGDKGACVNLVLEVAKDRIAQRTVGVQSRSYIEKERQWKHNVEIILAMIDGNGIVNSKITG